LNRQASQVIAEAADSALNLLYIPLREVNLQASMLKYSHF